MYVIRVTNRFAESLFVRTIGTHGRFGVSIVEKAKKFSDEQKAISAAADLQTKVRLFEGKPLATFTVEKV